MFRAGEGSTEINVRSLWFLLLYASDMLPAFTSTDRENVEYGRHDADLPDLIVEIVVAEAEQRLQTTLFPGYRSRTMNLNRVRGRVEHLRTASGRLMESGRVMCTFADQTIDRPRYRYLLVTLRRMSVDVHDRALRHRCLQAARALEGRGVKPNDPSSADLSREQYGRHDSADSRLVRLCRLFRDMSLPTHQSGVVSVPVLRRDEGKLRSLFEKAMFGYFEVHLNHGETTVTSPTLSWPSTGNPDDLDLLPRLKTDIAIKRPNKDIIVECKFAPAFTTNHGKLIVKPDFLRQLYVYCDISQQISKTPTSGVLLAAKTESHRGRDLDVTIGNHSIRVREIDLSLKPDQIREILNAAVS